MNHHDRRRRGRRAARLTALRDAGATLMRAGDEGSILRVLTQAARDLSGAAFAAVIARPLPEEHEEAGPPASGGARVHLAVAVGLSQEQETSLRRILLSREDLLAPLWQGGEPLRVPDPLALAPSAEEPSTFASQEAMAQADQEQPQGEGPTRQLAADQPLVSSLLAVPLLASDGQVQGGLLVGLHGRDQVSREVEALLVSFTAQAALALEKVRCMWQAQEQAQQLQAVLDQLAEGIVQVDAQGHMVRENAVARRLRERLQAAPEGEQALDALLQAPARLALADQSGEPALVHVPVNDTPRRAYAVTARPLHALDRKAGPFAQQPEQSSPPAGSGSGAVGAVVVWREVTGERAEKMTEQPPEEAEGELAAWARQARAILEAISDAVMLYDRRGSLLQVNRAARRLLGLDTVPDYASRPLKERLALYVMRDLQGQVLPKGQWPVSRVLRGEVLADEQAMEVLLRTVDGRQIQASFTGGPVREQDGRIIGGILTIRDLSGRYRLEREMQEAEQLARERSSQLEAIFETMPEALIVYDRQGRISRMNTAGGELIERLGLSQQAAAPLAERAAHEAVWDAQGQPLARESFPLARILAGEVLSPGQAVEMAIRDPQGEMAFLSVSGGPLHDAHGQLAGAVTVTRDITACKRAVQALREQGQQLQQQAELIEHAHDAILVRDAADRILSWNQGAQQLYGWSAEEALGQITHQLLQTQFPQSHEEVDHALEHEGSWEGELLHTCRDGRPVLVESRQVLIRDAQGAPSAILMINRDITEHRRLQQRLLQAEREARERARQLEAIFEAVPDALFVYDHRGRIAQFNTAAGRLFGLEREPDTLTRSLEQVVRLAPRDWQGQVLPREQWPVVRLLNGEVLTSPNMVEVMIRPLHGEQVRVSVAGTPLREPDGGVSGAVVTVRDLSERYRLERRLQTAEREASERASKLEAVFEAVPDILFIYDREGRITGMNAVGRAIIERLGLSDYAAAPVAERAAQELTLDEHGRPLAGESFPSARILAGEVLTPGRAVEIAMRDRSGEFVSLSVTGGPLQDAHGQLAGAVAVCRDISAGKRAEQALRQQAQQLQQQAELIELAHDAILVRDPAGQILSWNRGAEQLYGWSAQEVLGRVTHTLLQTRFPVSLAAMEAQLERAGQWEGELWHSSRDGRQVLVQSRQVLVRDAAGQPSALLEINRDITLRRQFEALEQRMHAATEARRSLLQLVLDELPSSVYLVRGHDARLILANRATTAQWGASWAVGQPWSEFLQQNGIRICGLDGRDLAPEQRATWRALQYDEAVSQHQEIIRHSDGTSLPVLVNAVPLDLSPLFPSLEEINLAGMEATEPAALVVHQDVSALKEAERLKDEFIAIAAHELRTPLSILKGYAETLLLGQDGRKLEVAPWQQEALDNIDLATRQLVELTEALLDVTRLQAGRLELHAEPSDLVALARRVVKRLQRTTQQHRLSLRSSQEHLVVTLDPARMEQVLTNLVGNAIKYSPRGGPIEVAVWAEPQTAEVILSARDEGIGIPAQQQASIFGRFFRADNARMLPGTGLGLYLCRSLVELHGGRLWFMSVEERGTTFFLSLPNKEEGAAPA